LKAKMPFGQVPVLEVSPVAAVLGEGSVNGSGVDFKANGPLYALERNAVILRCCCELRWASCLLDCVVALPLNDISTW
jgi:hypothetical protein